MHVLCDLSENDPLWYITILEYYLLEISMFDIWQHILQCIRSVRHIGGAMRGAGADQMPALVRSVLNCKTSKNALRFFKSLGYKLDYELLRVGFKFQFQKVVPIMISVSSICKMPKLHAIDEAMPISMGLQLVEIAASASADNYTEVATAVASFAEHLAP